MKDETTGKLPPEIDNQIEALFKESGVSSQSFTRKQFEQLWLEKFKLFTSQMKGIEMESTDTFAKEDPRGLILLTYSGSLICLGPKGSDGRWLEYASIKLRKDVPELMRAEGAALGSALARDECALFEGTSLRKSSPLFRISCCPEGVDPEEQDRRIKEAMIFLTNGFVKINKSLSLPGEGEVEQFTMKAMIGYVAKKNGLTQNITRSVIEDYLSTIETGVLLGERASLGPLGTASLRLVKAKRARVIKSLKNGADMLIPAKPEALAPKFSFSQSFKDKCSGVDPTLYGEEGQDDEEED